MKVYSYLRFSAARQAHGTSIERQAEYAHKWAESHGYTLDESLSMRDEGLSAYHQKHVKTGALGVFLEAVNAGKIPVGSVLVVEGLDRLSRTDPIDAQAQLAQIINGGITVVTAADGKTYSRESLKANPMDLIYSLLVMIRANEESETKSKRAHDVLRRKCVAWVNGTFRGAITCGNDPSWVHWNGEKFELEPVMAETLRIAIRMFTEGYGAVRILQVLSDKGLKITGGEQAGNVTRTLTNNMPLFIGSRTITSNGESYVLEGYYPALLTDDEYARLVVAADGRKQGPRIAGGKGEYPSVITGMRIATCGHCGGGLTVANQTRPPSYKGPQPIYRRVTCNVCTTASRAARKGSGFANVSATLIEKVILDFCSDQFNLGMLLEGDTQAGDLRVKHTACLGRIAELERQQDKFVEATLAGNTLPAALIAKLREIETQIAVEKANERALDAAMRSLSNTPDKATSTLWSEIKEGVLALDYDSRMKCRRLVQDTFRGIKLYFQGALPGTPAGIVDLVLTSKTGVSRWLRVDRKTGEVVGGRERVIQPPAC